MSSNGSSSLGVGSIIAIILGIIVFIGICAFIIWYFKLRDGEKDDEKLSKSMQEINTSQVVLKDEERERESEREGDPGATAPLTKNAEEVAMVNMVEIEEGDEDVGNAQVFNY